MTETQPDAELAARYVVSRLAAAAGTRLRQGARKPPLATGGLGEALDLVATTRLRGVSQPVANALVRWGQGEWRVKLLFRVPRPEEVLAWQAAGERCVSLLADGVVTAPHADGLAFALHDLCHLEKFVDPEHHVGQRGFFRAVHEATKRDGWGAFMARFDAELERDVGHVIADMNGSAVFLFAALKMKLKMAVRRRVGRERARRGGARDVAASGKLDDEEEGAFDAELPLLLDLLGLTGEGRWGASRVSTRRDEKDAALALLRHFERAGGG